MEFAYTLSENGAVILAELKGRLMDKSQSADLLTRLDEHIKGGKNKIILDLAGMDYMNSSGLNVLVNILTKARSNHGEVVVCNVSKKIEELFIITKLNTLFHVAENREAALNELNKK